MKEQSGKEVAKKMNTLGVTMFSVDHKIYKKKEKNSEEEFKISSVVEFPNASFVEDINSENYTEYIRSDWNGMAMKMGLNHMGEVILGIDVDVVPSVKYAEELKKMFKKEYGIDPYCRTKSGGYHYLLKVSDEYFNNQGEETKPFSSDDGNLFKFHDKEYRIDIKCNNQILYTAPTKISYHGKVYKYELLADLDTYEIPENIDFELDLLMQIKEHKNAEKKHEKKREVAYINNKYDRINFIFENISVERSENYHSWVNGGLILRNEIDEMFTKKQGKSVWKMFSWRSTKHDEPEENLSKLWNGFKTPKNNKKPVTLNTALFWLKTDNPEKYQEYWDKYNGLKLGPHFDENYLEYLNTEEEKLYYFSYYHVMVLNPLHYIEVEYNVDDGTPRVYKLDLIKSLPELSERYDEHRVYTSDGHDYDIVKYWKRSLNKRKYMKIVFKPGKICDSRFLNSARPFEITFTKLEPLSKEELKSYGLIDVLISKMCRDDIKSKNYLLNWLAHLIQKPWEKPGVAILMMSESEGTGKNTFWQDLIGEMILGENLYYYASRIDDVTGRFNSNRAFKLLTICDELNKSAFDNKDYMKTLLTSKRLNFEKKNVDSISLEDHSRFVFLTNNVHPLLLSDTDRRHACYENSLDLVGNREFFNEIYDKVIENPKILRHFYEKLLTRDISKFELRDIPETKFKREIIMMSGSPFLCSLEHNYEEFADKFVSSRELLERAKQYGRDNGINVRNMKMNKMSREYNKLNKIMKDQTTGKVRGFRFENLKVLKKYFDC